MSVDTELTAGKPLPTIHSLDGWALKQLIEAGLTWLRSNQQIVNALNVFPVPDGDTGTNMVLTMQAAFDEIAKSPEQNFGKMAHAVAHGALMGARGNSGVILSQLWRGFARAVDNVDHLDCSGLAKAFAEARDTAYKGVVRPVEGTILTVAKDIAIAAEVALEETQDPRQILEQVVLAADQSVQRTPELLNVLKEAGVVDAGGKGLFFVLEGMLRYLNGQSLDQAIITVSPLSTMVLDRTMESIEPGQDYEIVLDFQPFRDLNITDFYYQLEQMGTSIQVGEGEGLYRLHIHVPTEKRYAPIDYAMSLGTVTKIAIENLIAQMETDERGCSDEEPVLAPVEPGQIAVIAVSPGIGISRVFASLGANGVVEGGQTMNPSTQEILHSFEDLPSEKIIILPNNKNIILTARETAHLTSKKIAVIPSRSVPQGLTAMLRLIPDGDFENVVEEMTASLNEVKTGEITTATRSVEIDGVEALAGQFISLLNGDMVLSTNNLEDACLGLLEKAHADQFELITLFFGANLTRKEADQIADLVRSRYPDQEIEIQEGCQPHYHFILAIE